MTGTARASSSRGAFVLASGMAAAAVFGLLFQSLLSNYFGAGAETDAFFMSVSIFAFLSKFMMLGALKSIALPIYQARDSGEVGLGGLVRLILFGLSVVVLALVVLAPILVRVLAPGFDADAAELTTRLLRIRLPALVFTAVITVGIVTLEARGRFGLSVLATKVVPAIAAFAGLAWATNRFGIDGAAWIGLFSALAGFAFLWMRWPSLFHGSARLASRDPQVRGIGRRWLRFSQSTVATMAGEWVFRIGASLLPVGLFSAVLYGRRVHDVLHGAVNDSVNTVTLPDLARVAPSGDVAVGQRLGNRLEALVSVSLPLAGVVVLTSGWIVSVLFGRGRFLEDGMSGPTAAALSIFTFGFLIQGMNQLFFSAAYATDRSHLVNRVQTIGHLVRAVVLIPLVLWVGYVGLVAGQVFMNVLVLGAIGMAWPKELAFTGTNFLRRLGRIGLVSILPLVGLWFATTTLGDPNAYTLLPRAAVLAALGVVPLGLYGALARQAGIQLPALPIPRRPWGRTP